MTSFREWHPAIVRSGFEPGLRASWPSLPIRWTNGASVRTSDSNRETRRSCRGVHWKTSAAGTLDHFRATPRYVPVWRGDQCGLRPDVQAPVFAMSTVRRRDRAGPFAETVSTVRRKSAGDLPLMESLEERVVTNVQPPRCLPAVPVHLFKRAENHFLLRLLGSHHRHLSQREISRRRHKPLGSSVR